MMKLKFLSIILLTVSLQAHAKTQKYSQLDEVDCIAAVVYLEARGESTKHQLAVAKAVKRWSAYNDEHVCKTVTTGSYISRLDTVKLKQIRKLKNDDWITSKMVAQLSYSTYDPSHGATHFWNRRIPHDP
jgi:hypothetical protein